MPPVLRRIYSETVDCYNNDNLILCAAGVRALVDGLCMANNVIDGEVERKDKSGNSRLKREKNLEGKINGLYEKRILTEINAKTLHELRFLGNTAIHELAVPYKGELALALSIAEHIFESIYEIPRKAEELRDKRLTKPHKPKDRTPPF